jgi:hypothetical protein
MPTPQKINDPNKFPFLVKLSIKYDIKKVNPIPPNKETISFIAVNCPLFLSGTRFIYIVIFGELIILSITLPKRTKEASNIIFNNVDDFKNGIKKHKIKNTSWMPVKATTHFLTGVLSAINIATKWNKQPRDVKAVITPVAAVEKPISVASLERYGPLISIAIKYSIAASII